MSFSQNPKIIWLPKILHIRQDIFLDIVVKKKCLGVDSGNRFPSSRSNRNVFCTIATSNVFVA